MESDLRNKTILVVGAGGFLGWQLCEDLMRLKAHVIASDVNIELLEVNASNVLDSSNLELLQLNINSSEQVKAAFAEFPLISGVVNSAYPRNTGYGSLFEDIKLDDFNENLALNLGGAFVLLQSAVESFKKNKREMSLVNISSIYGVVAPEFSVYDGTNMTMPFEYAAIKSAMQHMSKYIVKYVGDSRFRVNCVCPGGLLNGQDEGFLRAYRDKTLGKGMLHPKDISGSIEFLLSDKSTFINGQDIIVDDGFVL